MASLTTIKRIASRILDCGVSRVRIRDAKAAAEALTAEDVRQLIKQGAVEKTPFGGTGRGKARIRIKRKAEGRGRGEGSRKGTPGAVMTEKRRWMKKVRGLRKLLHSIKPKLKDGAYKQLYKLVKGGSIRDKRQLIEFVNTNSLFNETVRK